ncbi:SurA N-terminal domain-containing protein [Jannaschia sp. LMIT008]|uniref:SurA N-terminal domain-containing protein n=1 Tax=Jannaschia maritima TaxID=3032585 RepID=UPI0028122675|nr:SurA N-terminal domain-containing protein [Jannaschia sp. LMIT008]
MKTLSTLLVLVACALCLMPRPAAAQSLFAPVATVNGTVINQYQVQQRARFLGLLRAPDADFESALDRLIEEAVQVQAARAEGIDVSAEDLDAAMVEFAGRANLAPDRFVAELERNGVAPETFRDFVRNGLLWRELVQARFGPRARPSEETVRRALAQGTTTSGTRVLLSEIALPLPPERVDEFLRATEELAASIDGPAAFEEAARRFSRAPSAERGGRLDWIPVAGLAPALSREILALAPGQRTRPLNLGAFVGIYLLRAIDEGLPVTADTLSVDYAELRLPGGRTPETLARAQRIRDRIDTCDDLYAAVAGQTVARETFPVSQLPADLRQVLAALDENEVTTVLSDAGALRFVMLCERVTDASEDLFQRVGQQLLTQRLTDYARGYLDSLRADAVITRP